MNWVILIGAWAVRPECRTSQGPRSNFEIGRAPLVPQYWGGGGGGGGGGTRHFFLQTPYNFKNIGGQVAPPPPPSPYSAVPASNFWQEEYSCKLINVLTFTSCILRKYNSCSISTKYKICELTPPPLPQNLSNRSVAPLQLQGSFYINMLLLYLFKFLSTTLKYKVMQHLYLWIRVRLKLQSASCMI